MTDSNNLYQGLPWTVNEIKYLKASPNNNVLSHAWQTASKMALIITSLLFPFLETLRSNVTWETWSRKAIDGHLMNVQYVSGTSVSSFCPRMSPAKTASLLWLSRRREVDWGRLDDWLEVWLKPAFQPGLSDSACTFPPVTTLLPRLVLFLLQL